MKVDLSEERFIDIEKRLLELEIKYTLTRDMALEINEKHDALEEALMKYHHEKMKEINRTLSDFWKMTYKGNDIDTIEIKSDVERNSAN
jgi:DNA repair protein RAD50